MTQIDLRTAAPLLREWSCPEDSALAAAVAERRQAGLAVHDFITAHPYDHGFQFDAELLADIYAEAVRSSARYAADPLGQRAARESVAAHHSAQTDPANILLTPGTSMAYFTLFRLLARPHGEILCPAPTYPLFDDLAKIAGMGVRRYHLEKMTDVAGTTRWAVNPDELAFQITPRTCAIVLVSPHNPTGSVACAEELRAISDIANTAGIPVIHDEVFRNYTRDPAMTVGRVAERGCRLAFTLNGLSKSHYLPGIKAGWLVAEGADELVNPVMNALEYFSDSFLPVQEQTQAAMPRLLSGEGLGEATRLANLQRERLEWRLKNSSGWNVAVPESGPYVCMAPVDVANTNVDDLALALLKETGALFHPGSYYAFPESWLVATIFNDHPWPTGDAIYI